MSDAFHINSSDLPFKDGRPLSRAEGWLFHHFNGVSEKLTQGDEPPPVEKVINRPRNRVDSNPELKVSHVTAEQKRKTFHAAYIHDTVPYFIYSILPSCIQRDRTHFAVWHTLGEVQRFVDSAILDNNFTSRMDAIQSTRHPDFGQLRNEIQNYMASQGMDPGTQLYILQEFDGALPRLKQYHELGYRMEQAELFSQLARGKLEYTTPLFDEMNAHDRFAALETLLHRSPHLTDESSGMVSKGIADMVGRIVEHEKLLHDKNRRKDELRDAKEAREEARRQEDARLRADALASAALRAEEKAREEIATEQRKRAEFMAEPQPFQWQWRELEELAQGGSSYHKQAEEMYNLAQRVCEQLDRRGKGIEEFGRLLFSNAEPIARAYDLQKPLQLEKIPAYPPATKAEKLRRLYTTSSDVRSAVNRLLSDYEGIMFLASITRSSERVQQYVRSMRQEQKDLRSVDGRATSAIEATDGFTPDELAGLTSERERAEMSNAIDLFDIKHQNITRLREGLAQEIRQAFDGKNIKKIAAVQVPLSELAQKEGVTLSPDMMDAMGEDFHPQKSDKGVRYVDICSNEFPFKRFTVKLPVGTGEFKKQIKEKLAECEQHRVNSELVAELGEKCGFMLEHKNGHTLMHPEYGIVVSLDTPETAQTQMLVDAKLKFDEKHFLQDSLLESAKALGFVVTGVDAEGVAHGTIELKHPEAGAFTLGTRGYLQQVEFDDVGKAITKLQKQQVPHAFDEPDVLPHDPVRKSWNIGSNENLMIFDDGPISRLTALREGKSKTWLDVVKQTAKLKNVRILIPSVVADWELQGKVPKFDKQGHRTGFDQIDMRYRFAHHPLNKIAEPVGKMLQHASRATIAEDGNVTLEEGSNPNIIIVDTPGDKALWSRIRAIEAGPKEEQIPRYQNEVHGRGEGEAAINRVIAGMNVTNRYTIVSDDMVYLRHAPRWSAHEAPVAHAGLAAYLEAELSSPSREIRLRGHLREEEPISVGRIFKEINASVQEDRPDDYIYPNSYAYPPRRKSGSIYDMLGHSVQATYHNNGAYDEGHANGNGNGKTNGFSNGSARSSWAAAGPRAAHAPRGITPDSVNDRPDDGRIGYSGMD